MNKCIKCLNIIHPCPKKKTTFLLEQPEYNSLLEDDECGICLELLKCSPCIKTENCNHIFHKYCYKKYLEKTNLKKKKGCPFCNSDQENLNIYIFENN